MKPSIPSPVPIATSSTAWLLALIISLTVGVVGCDRAPSERDDAPNTSPAAGVARFSVLGAQVLLGELACETTRDVAGNVVGWMARFHKPKDAEASEGAAIRDIGTGTLGVYVTNYHGDGVYRPDTGLRAALSYSTSDGRGNARPAEALSISKNGKQAELAIGDIRVFIECDPRQNTDTGPGPALAAESPPASGYVTDEHGSVFRFGNLKCGARADTLHVVSGDPDAESVMPSLELWLTDVRPKVGTYTIQQASYRYHASEQAYADIEPPSVFGWSIEAILSEQEKAVEPRAVLRITREQPLSGEFELVRGKTRWTGAFVCALPASRAPP